MTIRPARTEDLAAVREIFREYAAWVGDAICFAAFERELAELPGRYAPPGGALLLAFSGAERFRMGARMFEVARRMALASLPVPKACSR